MLVIISTKNPPTDLGVYLWVNLKKYLTNKAKDRVPGEERLNVSMMLPLPCLTIHMKNMGEFSFISGNFMYQTDTACNMI